MSVQDAFKWWLQAPFACALFQGQTERPDKMEFVTANAVFKIVTGLSQEELALRCADDFNLRAVYFSSNTVQQYQVHSYSPQTGYLLVVMYPLPKWVPAAMPIVTGAETAQLTTLLLDIAQRFIGVLPAQLPALIQQTLADLGEAVSVDRVYIFEYNFAKKTCSNTYEWCVQGVLPEIESLQGIPLSAVPQWVNAHLAGQEMYIPDAPSLPDGDPLKQILQPQGIKSLLAIPFLSEQQLIGFVGFDSVKKHHYYSEQERMLLGVFARMLVNINRTMQLNKVLL